MASTSDSTRLPSTSRGVGTMLMPLGPMMFWTKVDRPPLMMSWLRSRWRAWLRRATPVMVTMVLPLPKSREAWRRWVFSAAS